MYEGPGQRKVHMLIIGDTEKERERERGRSIVKFAHMHALPRAHMRTHKRNKWQHRPYAKSGMGREDLWE